MTRPASLPEYRQPPLNEVVMGIQFRPAEGYHQILAGHVWSLFKKRFSRVEEHQRLAPQFETFGLNKPGTPQIQLVSGAEHDRFWFVTPNGDELIQFQSDRLLHNWRNNGKSSYPRFEKMASEFESQARKLESYFSTLNKQKLDITQCEITYINHVKITGKNNLRSIEDVINLVSFLSSPDDASLKYRRTIINSDGNKSGRLYVECSSAYNSNGEAIVLINLTARGAPISTEISDAIAFLRQGRDMIVNEFTSITTDVAHNLWERIK